MKRLTPLVFSIVLSTLLTAPASAWQGWCRQQPGAAISRTAIEQSICEVDAAAEPCVEGVQSARGVQLGEHTYLTREGMRLAGLSATHQDTPHVFQGPQLGTTTAQPRGYFVDAHMVDAMTTTLEPTGAGSMSRYAPRLVTIPEVSEVPDIAHSLTQYVMGNEHCLPRGVPATTTAEINLCNSFTGHMASINSTHWPELSRPTYTLYHGIALDVAARCKLLADALPSAAEHPLSDYAGETVKACEREALAYEAYASHFLQDRWSSGHMFRRWGSPTFADSPVGQVQQTLTGIVTGLIHGTRALTKNHDQLSMPGPFDEDDDSTTVRFVSSQGGVINGGGDHYLLACRERDTGWNVREGAQLREHYSRMMACVAHGFAEVYAAGPKTDGDRSLSPDVPASPLPAGESYAESDDCWDHWVTNRSMAMALGSGEGIGFDTDDFPSPSWLTRVKLKVVLNGAPFVTHGALPDRELPVTRAQLTSEETRLRFVLARLAMIYTRRAARRPTGTDLARMVYQDSNTPDPNLRRVFGTGVRGPADWSGAFADDVSADRVSFFASPDANTWDDEPIAMMSCTNDADCPAHTFCDRTAVDAMGATSRQCSPNEVALMRGFRAAELPRWCGADRWSSLNAAREACKNAPMGEASVQCDACVQMVAPRLRNACEPGGFDRLVMAGDRDPRALCEILRDAGGAHAASGNNEYVHYPYELRTGETPEAALVRAARSACFEGEEAEPWDVGISYDPGPPAAAQNVGDGVMAYYWEESHCGTDGEHWWRFEHIVGSAHTLHVRLGRVTDGALLTPHGDISDWELVGLQGPACDPASTPVFTATPQDEDGDGQPELLKFIWSATGLVREEICVRLRANDPSVRGRMSLSVGRF